MANEPFWRYLSGRQKPEDPPWNYVPPRDEANFSEDDVLGIVFAIGFFLYAIWGILFPG